MGPTPCLGSLAAVCSQGFLPLGSAPLDRPSEGHWEPSAMAHSRARVAHRKPSGPGWHSHSLSHCWAVLGTFQ